MAMSCIVSEIKRDIGRKLYITTICGKAIAHNYFRAVFLQARQIPGVSGGENSFCKSLLFYSQLKRVTDGLQTDRWQSDLNSAALTM